MTGFQRIEKAMHNARIQLTDAAVSFTVNNVVRDRDRQAISCNVMRQSDSINLFISVQKASRNRWYSVKVEYYGYTPKMHQISSTIYTPNDASAVCDIIHASIRAFTL